MRSVLIAILLIVSVGLHSPAWVQYSTPHEPAFNASTSTGTGACELGLPTPVDQPALLKSAFADVLVVTTGDSIDWLPAERVSMPRPPAVHFTLQSQHVLLRI
ncbi:hypothetical protein [Aeoliella sp. SH292]|uniref:hypothetical protein n=1 Tax=Aeoliella sp. SH292 TaxID=3454464 RepID=UPI003F9D6DA7